METSDIISLLDMIIESDLQVKGSCEGECIFCGAQLDEGQGHFSVCIYNDSVKIKKHFSDIIDKP